MVVVVAVDGKEYNLGEKEVSVMKYITEAEAMAPGQKITITNIDQKTFEFILQILKVCNYQIKEPPKIADGVIEDYIGKELAGLIAKLDSKELNNLYRAVHYLKIYPLRRCIAAVLAHTVFIKPSLDNYHKKKQQLKLVSELTTEKSREYKERFPFIN